MATTSGTVSAYPFNQRKVIDHAARRAGILPQMNSAENLQVAQDIIFTLTSEWLNSGKPLWTRQFYLLGTTIGSPEVTTPQGTNDVDHCYWRILNPYRGPATTSGGADASVLFAGAPNSDVVITGPNPYVTVAFGSATEVDTIGVLTGGSTTFTAALQLYTSTDGITFTLAQTLPSATYTPGQWTYFDLDPTLTPSYLRIEYVTAGSWTINQLQFALSQGTDIEIGPLNIDDYYNLPDKLFQADQSNSGYVDRQLLVPVIKLWPTPNQYAFYNACVSVLSHRYIQDPGALTNNIEVPQRWLEALTARLAVRLIEEIPPDPGQQAQNPYAFITLQQKMDRLDKRAATAEALAWSEETNKSPIRWAPNISVYTK